MDVSDAVKKVTRCRFPAGQHCLTNLLRHSMSQLESDTFALFHQEGTSV